MSKRLVIDGNAVYEIDEECVECRKKKKESVSGNQNAKKKGSVSQGKKSLNDKC